MITNKDIHNTIIKQLQLTGEPATANVISHHTKLPLSLIRHEIMELARMGKICSDRRYPCSYWVEADTPARTITSYGQTATYDGAELRPYTGRPGSMDAYALKSRGMG